MKRYAGLLGALAVLAFVGFYGAVFAAVTAAPAHTIYAPTSAVSGSDFVAAWDATGCGNKPPVVAWTYPAGCTIAGQGQATARFTCIGARGVSIPLSATATAGRPLRPATDRRARQWCSPGVRLISPVVPRRVRTAPTLHPSPPWCLRPSTTGPACRARASSASRSELRSARSAPPHELAIPGVPESPPGFAGSSKAA